MQSCAIIIPLQTSIELQQRTDDARASFKDCQRQRWYQDTWRDLKRSAFGTVPCCAKHVLASFRLQLQEPFFRPRSNSEGPESLHWPAEARRASCTQAVRQAHLAELNFGACFRKLSGQVTSSNFVVEFSLDTRCILLLPSWSSSCQAEFITRVLRIRWNSRGIPSNLSCKDLPLYQDIATETNLRQPSFRECRSLAGTKE